MEIRYFGEVSMNLLKKLNNMENNKGLILIVVMLLGLQIMFASFASRERDCRMEEKIDSLTITLGSIQNKLDSITINKQIR
jgi:hypothetical protein